jgi:hypothetical protein
VTPLRSIGGQPNTDQSRAWAHRQVRAAQAVVQTYARRLSEQARGELRGAREQLDRRDTPARGYGLERPDAGCPTT